MDVLEEFFIQVGEYGDLRNYLDNQVFSYLLCNVFLELKLKEKGWSNANRHSLLVRNLSKNISNMHNYTTVVTYENILDISLIELSDCVYYKLSVLYDDYLRAVNVTQDNNILPFLDTIIFEDACVAISMNGNLINYIRDDTFSREQIEILEKKACDSYYLGSSRLTSVDIYDYLSKFFETYDTKDIYKLKDMILSVRSNVMNSVILDLIIKNDYRVMPKKYWNHSHIVYVLENVNFRELELVFLNSMNSYMITSLKVIITQLYPCLVPFIPPCYMMKEPRFIDLNSYMKHLTSSMLTKAINLTKEEKYILIKVVVGRPDKMYSYIDNEYSSLLDNPEDLLMSSNEVIQVIRDELLRRCNPTVKDLRNILLTYRLPMFIINEALKDNSNVVIRQPITDALKEVCINSIISICRKLDVDYTQDELMRLAKKGILIRDTCQTVEMIEIATTVNPLSINYATFIPLHILQRYAENLDKLFDEIERFNYHKFPLGIAYNKPKDGRPRDSRYLMFGDKKNGMMQGLFPNNIITPTMSMNEILQAWIPYERYGSVYEFVDYIINDNRELRIMNIVTDVSKFKLYKDTLDKSQLHWIFMHHPELTLEYPELAKGNIGYKLKKKIDMQCLVDETHNTRSVSHPNNCCVCYEPTNTYLCECNVYCKHYMCLGCWIYNRDNNKGICYIDFNKPKCRKSSHGLRYQQAPISKKVLDEWNLYERHVSYYEDNINLNVLFG